MRLKPEIEDFINNASLKYFQGAEVYLFGSRVNEHAKGGDIDLLILSDTKINQKNIRQFRVNFYQLFGWQKVDVVNFTKNEENTFKQIALKRAILINDGRTFK